MTDDPDRRLGGRPAAGAARSRLDHRCLRSSRGCRRTSPGSARCSSASCRTSAPTWPCARAAKTRSAVSSPPARASACRSPCAARVPATTARSCRCTAALILDISGYNAFGWARDGAGRAQAGIRLGDFDKAAQPLGWELRWLPSTFRAATLGGLFGGGFGGAGSITYGPIAAAGNVLGVRVMSVEPEPQVVELRGAEALLVHHKWGTNGIVLELEIALAPALPWVEMIATFTTPRSGAGLLHHAQRRHPRHRKEGTGADGRADSGLLHRAGGAPACGLPCGADAGGCVFGTGARASSWRPTTAASATARTWPRFARAIAHWSNTAGITPRCRRLKIDKGLTYLQARFDPARQREQVLALHGQLSPEVMLHLEFIRLTDGRHTCSSLPLVRFSTEQRLAQLAQAFLRPGCDDQRCPCPRARGRRQASRHGPLGAYRPRRAWPSTPRWR